MSKYIILIIGLFLSFLSIAQQSKVDSLLAVPEQKLSNDSIKTKHYIRIFVAYNRIPDFKKVAEYGQKALETSKNLKNTDINLNVYERLGMCYHGNSDFLTAEKIYLKGIEIAKLKNNVVKEANFYLNLSALYSTISDYNKALENIKIALNLYKQAERFDDMNSCYMNMGNVYLLLKQPLRAIEYIKKANIAFVQSENGVNYGVYSANMSLAEAYMNCKKSDLNQLGLNSIAQQNMALKHLNNALKVAQGMNDNGMIGNVNLEMAELYDQINDDKKAIFHYDIALKIIEELKIDENLSDLYLSMGSHYLKTKSYELSKDYLNKSLSISQKINLLENQKDALEKLSALAEKTRDYKSAYQRHVEFIQIRDKIIDEEKEKEITRKQLKLDFEIKENDYKTKQDFDNKIQWILGISATILLILFVIIYLNQGKTQRLNTLISKQKLELEQLGIVKDKMFSLVSHDLRSPVNALISFITLLENKQISQEKLGLYASELKNQLNTTTNLMENMLNWAASQMQGYKPNMQIENIFEISNVVIQSLNGQANLKGIEIDNRIDSKTKAFVDAEMLGLIIRNLLANAIKFSDKNGKIELSSSSENDSIKLKIADKGVGMTPEKLKQINDDENLLIDSTTGTLKEKGTGIGLMLCKTFAKLIKGNLTANSKVNEGSEFVLELKKTN